MTKRLCTDMRLWTAVATLALALAATIVLGEESEAEVYSANASAAASASASAPANAGAGASASAPSSASASVRAPGSGDAESTVSASPAEAQVGSAGASASALANPSVSTPASEDAGKSASEDDSHGDRQSSASPDAATGSGSDAAPVTPADGYSDPAGASSNDAGYTGDDDGVGTDTGSPDDGASIDGGDEESDNPLAWLTGLFSWVVEPDEEGPNEEDGTNLLDLLFGTEVEHPEGDSNSRENENTPTDAGTPSTVALDLDETFISRHEGGQLLNAYVPQTNGQPIGKSGVTVATGVDLGQMSEAQIRALGIPQSLADKLVPYAGPKKGQDAINHLKQHPLRLTQAEADALDQAMSQKINDELVKNYNRAARQAFTDLPREAQTVIADVAYHYGTDLAKRTPNFWNQVTQGRWDEAVANLRNFGDKFGPRRTAEANLLQSAIDRGALPGTRTSER